MLIQLETRRALWKRARLGRSRAYLNGDTLALLNMLLVRSYNCFILSVWPEGDHLPARAVLFFAGGRKGSVEKKEGACVANRHAAFKRESSPFRYFALPEVLPGRPRLFNRPSSLINAVPPCNFAKLLEKRSYGTFRISRSDMNRQQ